jgi:uracil-DNA glycosylase
VKCKVTDKNQLDEKDAFRKCRENYLYREIDSLPNLELIIAAGERAFESIKAVASQGSIVKLANSIDLERSYNHGEVYQFKYRRRKEPIYLIRFYHPTYFYDKNKGGYSEELRELIFQKGCEHSFGCLEREVKGGRFQN